MLYTRHSVAHLLVCSRGDATLSYVLQTDRNPHAGLSPLSQCCNLVQHITTTAVNCCCETVWVAFDLRIFHTSIKLSTFFLKLINSLCYDRIQFIYSEHPQPTCQPVLWLSNNSKKEIPSLTSAVTLVQGTVPLY